MATYKHIRSNVDSKRPTTSLADGQIAINTNVASPGVFFKDSAGTGIVKVGPVHVGTSAPNSTPGAGGSTGNSKGEQWLDTSLTPAQLKVWNGSAWVGVVADELPVSKLQNGSAYQLLQTDAAGTGVEWASDIDVPGSLNVTSTAVFDSTASHPLGSAAAPTITFTGDANTGIYSPGIDQIALSTAGTSRLHVAADGKIGVGTASPATTFDINGDLTIADKIIHGGDTNTAIRFPAADTVSIETAGFERVRVDNAGNLGVGTSSPSVKLDVDGDVNIATSGEFRVAGTKVLDATSLGSAVVSSSLTSVGTIGTGVWNGTAIATAYIADSAVTSAKIADGTIINADVNASAAIAGTKISPDFGSQTVTTTGLISADGKVSFPLGTAALPSLYPGSDTNTGIYSPGADQLAISTNGTERLQVDSSGNVKIASEHLRFNTSGKGIIFGIDGGSNRPSILGNYTSSTNNELIFSVTGTERMRIDSSGRLLVGTSTSPSAGNGQYAKLVVQGFVGGTGAAFASLQRAEAATSITTDELIGVLSFDDSSGNTFAEIAGRADGTAGTSDYPGRLVFSTTADGAGTPTERMRIGRKGFTKFKSGASSYFGVSGEYHEFTTDSNNWTLICENEGNSVPYGILIRYSGTTPNNTSSQFFTGSDNTGDRIQLRSNGGIANYQSNDANLCDEREKKNIETLDSTWGCLRNWELKKFHYNEDDDNDDKRYGVIAQQVEQHCPEVITDWTKQRAEDAVLDDDGNVVTPAKEEILRKGVKEQQMMWMAIKALQEAQVRIETLESEVAALKAQ